MKISPTYSKNQHINSKINIKKIFKLNLSGFLLILTNIFVIFLAIYEKWDLSTLLWIYWFQSIIIGLFTFIKILNLKNFTTENFYINHRAVEPTKQTKNFTAFFFLIHYGAFHLGYLTFLLKETSFNFSFVILLGIVSFASNHLYSFIKNFKQDTEKKQNIGKVMFFPYARIIPMHIIIVSGLFFQEGLIIFLVLKSIADLIMHQIEHY